MYTLLLELHGQGSPAVLMKPCHLPLGFSFCLSPHPLCLGCFCWYLLTLSNHQYSESQFGGEPEQPLFSKTKLCLSRFVITKLGFHVSRVPS